MIGWIDSGQHSFCVAAPGKSVGVVVAVRNGRKYLKTEADGAEPNDLLALAEC